MTKLLYVDDQMRLELLDDFEVVAAANGEAVIRHPAVRPWPGGSDAFPSVETSRVYHATRRRGGLVAAGARSSPVSLCPDTTMRAYPEHKARNAAFLQTLGELG